MENVNFPSTEEVRSFYGDMACGDPDDPAHLGPSGECPSELEFDQWLEHIKASVWAEGCKAGLDTGLSIAENVHENGGWLQLKEVPEPPVNPYGEER